MMKRIIINECGIVSFWGLLLLFMVVLLGVTISILVRRGSDNNEEYLRETRLRLAAESSVERVAHEIETGYLMLNDKSDGQVYQVADDEYTADNVNVKVYVTSEKTIVYLEGWASETDSSDIWSRRKIVRAALNKTGDAYVWQGWRNQ